MEYEIEKLKNKLSEISKLFSGPHAPIVELNESVNPKEVYLYANRGGFIKMAFNCLEMASKDLDSDGDHLHLDMQNIFKKSPRSLVLEVRNDWEVE